MEHISKTIQEWAQQKGYDKKIEKVLKEKKKV